MAIEAIINDSLLSLLTEIMTILFEQALACYSRDIVNWHQHIQLRLYNE